ncbi:hypothetical protein AB4Y42_12680 [Paraburkholderia sp. EG286B]|uniref:hypothetical protein n=1 Tax=Paraburkholderia sp. EG286B TaxID=3237011 RepID=UPI0034D2E92D
MPLRLKLSLSFLHSAFVLLAALPQAAWSADRINDFSAVPYLNARQKTALVASYLAAPPPKAIAIGSTSGMWASGAFDPARSAMRQCWKVLQYCQL